jgi:hypothetical protein
MFPLAIAHCDCGLFTILIAVVCGTMGLLCFLLFKFYCSIFAVQFFNVKIGRGAEADGTYQLSCIS